MSRAEQFDQFLQCIKLDIFADARDDIFWKVIGGSVPSWVNSIPGPKYVYSIDVTKPRQPVRQSRQAIVC